MRAYYLVGQTQMIYVMHTHAYHAVMIIGNFTILPPTMVTHYHAKFNEISVHNIIITQQYLYSVDSIIIIFEMSILCLRYNIDMAIYIDIVSTARCCEGFFRFFFNSSIFWMGKSKMYIVPQSSLVFNGLPCHYIYLYII